MTTEPVFERHVSWWIFLLIGAVGGFMAGLFGVGGGVVMVPLLVMFAKLTQRIAAGTSLAVIIPTALAGSLSYAIDGNVDWLAALIIAAGSIGGAQIGTYLLNKLRQRTLVYSFVAFQAAVIVSLWLVIPDRSAAIGWSPLVGVLLFVLGVFTGILAGLLGAGGGIVVVPALIVLFGASDLVAKGTSLVMMIPGSISGTLANIRRKNIDIRAALFTSIGAVALAPFGSLAATSVSALAGNILFSVLIGAMAARSLISQLRNHNKDF